MLIKKAVHIQVVEEVKGLKLEWSGADARVHQKVKILSFEGCLAS